MARANNNQRGSGGSFDDDEGDVIIAFARFASAHANYRAKGNNVAAARSKRQR